MAAARAPAVHTLVVDIRKAFGVGGDAMRVTDHQQPVIDLMWRLSAVCTEVAWDASHCVHAMLDRAVHGALTNAAGGVVSYESLLLNRPTGGGLNELYRAALTRISGATSKAHKGTLSEEVRPHVDAFLAEVGLQRINRAANSLSGTVLHDVLGHLANRTLCGRALLSLTTLAVSRLQSG